MPTGVIINALSVVFGGLLGGLVGNKLSEDFKTQINMIFGVCSMGMGDFIYRIDEIHARCYLCYRYRNRDWTCTSSR